ncbi:MAG: DMT family transporter [Alphaproteobacteria bacterium]
MDHAPANAPWLRAVPILFVLLWSSAFVATRAGLADVSPLAFLTVRFTLAAIVLVAVAVLVRTDWAALSAAWPHLAVAGVLINAFYLSGVYLALDHINAATMALIGALHPLLTALLARPMLGERLGCGQWVGLGLGVCGVALVVGLQVTRPADMLGPLFGFLGVCSLAFGTIYYRKHCRKIALWTANTIQLITAALTCALLMTAFERPAYSVTVEAVTTLLYLALIISLGAPVLLMFMLRHGEAGKVASYFYLTPGITAVMAWTFLGEALSSMVLVGFAVTSLGVWLAQGRATGAPRREQDSR